MSESWAIGVLEQDVSELARGAGFAAVRWLGVGDGSCFADPFGVNRGGRLSIFFEEYDFAGGRGRISVVEYVGGEFSPPRPVLERPHHLSYPYLVEDGGRWFMIPEQYQAGRVDLYEARAFPGGWERVTTLIPDFPGIDPTVVRHAGRWWMFLGHHEDDEGSILYMFSADDLRGPWRPHPQNPVVRRPHTTRPAGRPFTLDGRLIRPSQDGTRTYGGQVLFNRVTAMTEREYGEELVRARRPEDYWEYRDGLHTVCQVGGMLLIDAKRLHRQPGGGSPPGGGDARGARAAGPPLTGT